MQLTEERDSLTRENATIKEKSELSSYEMSTLKAENQDLNE